MNFSNSFFCLIVFFCINVSSQAQVIKYYEQEKESGEKIIEQKINFVDSLKLYHFEEYDKEGFLTHTYFSSAMDSSIYQGQYIYFDSTGTVKWTKDYTDGQLDGMLKSYWPNGNTKRIDTYSNDEWLKGNCYDSLGNEVAYYEFEKMPEFPGGKDALLQAVYSNLKYPRKARRNGVQGYVVVQFVVDKTGKMTDIKVVRSPGSSLTEATYDLMRKLLRYRWAPGAQDGEKVKVLYTLPVAFRLQ